MQVPCTFFLVPCTPKGQGLAFTEILQHRKYGDMQYMPGDMAALQGMNSSVQSTPQQQENNTNSPPNTPANLVAKQDDERQVDGEEVVKELQQVEVVRVLVGHQGEVEDGDQTLDDGRIGKGAQQELELSPLQDKAPG